MVGFPGASHTVDAVCHPFQPTVRRQTGQRRGTNTRLLGLAPGDQPPLTLRCLKQPLTRSHGTANYTENGLFCRYASLDGDLQLLAVELGADAVGAVVGDGGGENLGGDVVLVGAGGG